MDDHITDRKLTSALRHVSGDPPYNAVNWDALALRIQAAAVARARTGRALPWWEFAAGWSRAAVPLALAASIGAFALVATASSTTDVSTTESATLMGAVTGAVSDQALVASASGSTTESFAAEVLAQ
ncbi:MAG TPA: hypothetical protein VIC55_02620 [Gemmatimonadaceae bacterium]|jgi:hypothetical protein